MRPCGNLECSVSTGIHEGLTFGSGQLDEFGYWEHACWPCARAHEFKNPASGACWPFDWKAAKTDCYVWDKIADAIGKEGMDMPRPMGPSREGSKHCKSFSIASGGHREYCTCDTCF